MTDFLGLEWNVAPEKVIYVKIYFVFIGLCMFLLICRLIYLVIKGIRKWISGKKDPKPKEPEKLIIPAEELVEQLPNHRGFQVMTEFADQLNTVLQGINAERDCKFDKADLVKERIVIPLAIAMVQTKFAGIRKGYWTFAVWRDGVEYVGSTGKTLKTAMAELDEEEKKFLSMIEGRKVA